MKRNKHYKVKMEVPETSTSHNRGHEEHDLAYYIHDRVELVHQVFSVLKFKEIKAMAPACIRNISIDDLQELCTEELLGISSKRLCAILDGADPPSDTESSSQSPTPEQLETISLDSISSDEEILSQNERSKKKKHKHRRRDSKSKHKRSKVDEDEQQNEKSKASRAGLTVLELLELQARARAIRAQLQQEQIKPPSETAAQESTHSHSEDEVEIKEEPAEVVEISSDEEKPKIEELESKTQSKPAEAQADSVVKYVNDLVITVPQKKMQKIKLNRTKSVPQTTTSTTLEVSKDTTAKTTESNAVENIIKDKHHKDVTNKDNHHKDVTNKDNATKTKDKTRKKKKRLSNASDNDEITLQLSDTEKLDLLEDLDRKNFDNVSSDTCIDSDDEDICKSNNLTEVKDKRDKRKERKTLDPVKKVDDDDTHSQGLNKHIEQTDRVEQSKRVHRKSSNENLVEKAPNQTEPGKTSNDKEDSVIITEKETAEDKNDENPDSDTASMLNSVETDKNNDNIDKHSGQSDKSIEDAGINDDKIPTKSAEEKKIEGKTEEFRKSEGELTDRDSSEVEAVDLQPVVVCISDDEEGKTKKKKKKKDKKIKKDKKSKKKDFHECGDENFHKITETAINITDSSNKELDNSEEANLKLSFETQITRENEDRSEGIDLITPDRSQDSIEVNYDENGIELDLITPDKSQDSVAENKDTSTNEIDVITLDKSQDTEILEVKEYPNNLEEVDEYSPSDIMRISDVIYELSDDSSNDEDLGTNNVLSKEPTASEIEALSAKIDEIERVEVITDEEIREYESRKEEEMSWKDRYLDSKKVKTVLNTSNILNALRKKNRQLKKRLEESKIEMNENKEENTNIQNEENAKEDAIEEGREIAEGSIEHYNTLQGSTKYVNPVPEFRINDNLKKDAKILLRMYRKLLKYNNMNKQKNPNKKKKKKSKDKDSDDIIKT